MVVEMPGDTQTRMQDVQRDLARLREELAKLRMSGVNVASSKVQERPLGAILIAFAVGFLGSRLLFRS